MKRALILGCTGQGGSYLSEILLSREWQVHGFYRRSSTGNFKNIDHIKDRMKFHRGDLLDSESIRDAIAESHPDVIYNMADQDNVDWSYVVPHYSLEATAGGVLNVLEAVRKVKPDTKVFQPVSATIYGVHGRMVSENLPIEPMSPYAVFKAAAYNLSVYYRCCYDMRVSCGIMFNHESERRNEDYLLHRIAVGAVRIKQGKQSHLGLYGLSDLVDIGYAPEYMEYVVGEMESSNCYDFRVCTARPYSIKTLARIALMRVGYDLDLADRLIVETEGKNRPGPKQEFVGRQVDGFAPKYDALGMVCKLVDYYTEKLK